MKDAPILSKHNSGVNRYSEFIETEITEEEENDISVDSKMNQYDSGIKERLLTCESTTIEQMKMAVNSSKDSFHLQSSYWLKIKRCNTVKHHKPSEMKEQTDKVYRLKKILRNKKNVLKDNINKYNAIKRENCEMKKMILMKMASLNNY